MWRWKPNDVWLKLSDDAQSLYVYLCMDVFYLDLLTAAFPAETRSRGRAYIRQKLNNADKMPKRKAKLTEAGN